MGFPAYTGPLRVAKNPTGGKAKQTNKQKNERMSMCVGGRVDSNLQALRDTKGSVTTLAMETKLVIPPVLRSKLESDGPIGKGALQSQTSFQALDQAVSYLAQAHLSLLSPRLCTVLPRGREAKDVTVGCDSLLRRAWALKASTLSHYSAPLSFLRNHYCKPQGAHPEVCFLTKQKAASISIDSIRGRQSFCRDILSPSLSPDLHVAFGISWCSMVLPLG